MNILICVWRHTERNGQYGGGDGCIFPASLRAQQLSEIQYYLRTEDFRVIKLSRIMSASVLSGTLLFNGVATATAVDEKKSDDVYLGFGIFSSSQEKTKDFLSSLGDTIFLFAAKRITAIQH